MKSTIIGIYGASGFGREVLPLVREQADALNKKYEIVFVDDSAESKSLNGIKVLSFESFIHISTGELLIVIAIADSGIREKLRSRCIENGIGLLDVVANNVVIMDNINMEPGFILSPFVTLTSDIKIGKCFHANIYSYVAHNCIIGDYVTFAPAVKCNGNIHVGSHAYIGTGAIIKQGRAEKPLVIGDGAVIGAGAVVTKSVPAGMTVFGNPAIEFTKENVKRR